MRGNELLDKMELVDAAYVEAAEMMLDENKTERKSGESSPRKTKKRVLIRWIAAATCLSLAVLAGVSLLSRDGGKTTVIGGVERKYKNAQIAGTEMAIEWSWEYRTTAERYTQLTFEGNEFRSAGYLINAERLGEIMGTGEVLGYDVYEEKEHRMTAEIRGIAGISKDRMVAVKLEDEYYLFKNSEYDPPATFGELLDQYSLTENLPFERFAVCEGYKEKGYYQLEDDHYIWEVLSSCREAVFNDDDMWSVSERNYISFTATSDVLGVYKRVFYVTADGYIRTNVFDWAYLYDIGENAAKEIIAYATGHSESAEWEPYTKAVAGILTEIGEGYILINDSVLCSNPKDGMTFKVPTDDLRISRYIDVIGIEEGDIVVVNFNGDINVPAGNVVEGAYTLSEGILYDGGVAVPE